MTRPVFQQFCVTFPGTDTAPWHGIQEIRKQSWGTTHHSVMLDDVGTQLCTDTKWTDKEFQQQIIKAYDLRIAKLQKAEKVRRIREEEFCFERLDKLEAAALAEIAAMVKETKGHKLLEAFPEKYR